MCPIAVAPGKGGKGTHRERMHESNSSASNITIEQPRGTRSREECQKVHKIVYQVITFLALTNIIQAVPIMTKPPVSVTPYQIIQEHRQN